MSLRRRRLLLTAAALILLLALSVPITLAWYFQRTSSSENRLAAREPKGVQLWAQTADERFGESFGPLSASAFETGTKSYLAPVQEEDGCQYPVVGQLCLLSDRERPVIAESPGDPASAYNRLFCDSGLLPGNSISRRLIVRNPEADRISYVLAFTGGEPASLGEALQVEVVRLLSDGGAPVERERLSPLDCNQLLNRTFEGVLEPGGFEVYELRITFLSSAGGWYAGQTLQLSAEVWAYTGGTVHTVRNGPELLELLVSPALADGDTVAVLEDIQIDEFATDKMINLTVAPDKVLTVEALFEVFLPAWEDGRIPSGTIEISCGEGNGLLEVDAENIFLEAPGVALQWGRASSLPLPENCRVRLLNGESFIPS